MTTETPDTAPPEPDAAVDTPEQPVTEQPREQAPPGMTWDADTGRYTSTAPPEPRSLPWWKDRAHLGEWLVAESAHHQSQLQSRVESLQKQQVQAAIGNRLHNAADFFHHAALADVLSDDGTVDTEKLDAALTGIVQHSPYLAPNVAAPASQVTSEHAGIEESEDRPTFGELMRAAATNGRGVNTHTSIASG